MCVQNVTGWDCTNKLAKLAPASKNKYENLIAQSIHTNKVWSHIEGACAYASFPALASLMKSPYGVKCLTRCVLNVSVGISLTMVRLIPTLALRIHLLVGAFCGIA